MVTLCGMFYLFLIGRNFHCANISRSRRLNERGVSDRDNYDMCYQHVDSTPQERSDGKLLCIRFISFLFPYFCSVSIFNS